MLSSKVFTRNKISKGSRAVVTGAGSGIGRAFALELARRGGRVVCSDPNPAPATATAEAIQEQGGHALAVPCDVSRLEQV
ncbi:SDR family NAD(P)-dependent oxidoreductase, partial [Qipengyuania citrea]|uniref:SDR family NAD(P)-dependent oxidoreductase n=1 Tax=Qipengyuania citrea TaxID=225971 RepID=UPI003296CE84